MSAHRYIQQRLESRKADGLYRQLRPQNGLVDFCSNDYLGFARSETLQRLIKEEIQNHTTYANGSTGSRLLAGNTDYAEHLEQYIADYQLSEAALLFNSGYDANVGLFSSLPQRGDTVIHDELIHASIIDGIRLSYATRFSFKHNDMASLESKLKQAKGNCYVAVESLYSMDGDFAPLTELVALTKIYGANLIIDEAHATGSFGKGIVNSLNFENEIFARVITFGKALGCHGAVVVGSNLLMQYLVNFARSFIYTTAAPLHQLASIKMAYQYLNSSAEPIRQLHKKIELYNRLLNVEAGTCNNGPIQTIQLGSNAKAANTAHKLQEKGFDVRPILSPTVPAGTERIRICLHTFNEDSDIIELTKQIKYLIKHE